jgi:hypothetical protein
LVFEHVLVKFLNDARELLQPESSTIALGTAATR